MAHKHDLRHFNELLDIVVNEFNQNPAGYTKEDFCDLINLINKCHKAKYNTFLWDDESCEISVEDALKISQNNDKEFNDMIGDLKTLKTANKTSLVGAINEIYDLLNPSLQ